MTIPKIVWKWLNETPYQAAKRKEYEKHRKMLKAKEKERRKQKEKEMATHRYGPTSPSSLLTRAQRDAERHSAMMMQQHHYMQQQQMYARAATTPVYAKESELYQMKLHDELVFQNCGVLRVPGGWIYKYNGEVTFVPLHKSEFETFNSLVRT